MQTRKILICECIYCLYTGKRKVLVENIKIYLEHEQ